MTMKEYRTLYFSDNKAGRAKMSTEIERLSVYGWQIKNTEALDQGYGIGGAMLLGLAGKRKSQIMLLLERDRDGDYPPEPAPAPTRREQKAAAMNAVNDRAEQMIDKVIPGYANFRKKYKR